jgi:putative N6-adenine-specific DNA methylase
MVYLGVNECFAIAAPGLEPIVARELAALSITPRIEAGGVAWSGGPSSIAMANLWLRTASRVIVRVTEFKAKTFFELERQARRISWETYLRPGGPVTFRVTCRKSRLYHSDAVAQRLVAAVQHRLGVAPAVTPGDDAEEDDAELPSTAGGGIPTQLFIVRFFHDVCTVSADSSGDLLHRRGYRQAVAKAPLRETLGASMLVGSGWTGETALVDPMCGSGTIPIEAALLARRIPPGLNRPFAFFQWPEHDVARWNALVARATSQIASRSPVKIAGSDRDAGAVTAARANAERAGVASDVEFTVRAISEAERIADTGSLVTNPPYGMRTGDPNGVRNLYAQLGKVARGTFAGWSIALLSPEPRLDAQLGLDVVEAFRTTNGGIPVRLVTGQVPGGDALSGARPVAPSQYSNPNPILK